MWKFKTTSSTAASPLQDVIAHASSSANIRFVIYNLSQRRVEIATERGDCNAQFALDASTIDAIRNEAAKQKEEAIRHGLRVPQGTDAFALLAFDIVNKTVQLIQSAPEVAPINGILMAMVTEVITTSMHGAREPWESIAPCNEPSPQYGRVKEHVSRGIDEEAREFAKREVAKRRTASQRFPSIDKSDDETPFGVIDMSHKGIGLFD